MITFLSKYDNYNFGDMWEHMNIGSNKTYIHRLLKLSAFVFAVVG